MPNASPAAITGGTSVNRLSGRYRHSTKAPSMREFSGAHSQGTSPLELEAKLWRIPWADWVQLPRDQVIAAVSEVTYNTARAVTRACSSGAGSRNASWQNASTSKRSPGTTSTSKRPSGSSRCR